MTIQPEHRRSGPPSILRRRTVSVKHPRSPRGPSPPRRCPAGDEENDRHNNPEMAAVRSKLGSYHSALSAFEVKRFKARQRPRMWGGSTSGCTVPLRMTQTRASDGKRSLCHHEDESADGTTRPNKYARIDDTINTLTTTSPLLSSRTATKNTAKPNNAVRFTPVLVSDVWTRPYTPPEDVELLFYSKRDEMRFREDRRRRPNVEDDEDDDDSSSDEEEDQDAAAVDEEEDDDECSVESTSSTEDEASDEESDSDSDDDEEEQPPPHHTNTTSAASVIPANIAAPRSPCPAAAAAAPVEHGSFVSAY